jgi:hypothetical protein
MILITAITLSGCAGRVAVIGGIGDMVAIPKGSIIKDVPLPTTENKRHDVVVEKDSYLVSKDAVNRYQKARVG